MTQVSPASLYPQIEAFPSLPRLAALARGHSGFGHAVDIVDEPSHQRNDIFSQVDDHSHGHGVPAVGVDVAHIDHLHAFAVLLPQLDFFLIVEKVFMVLYLLYEDAVGVRHVEIGIEDGFVFLAELFDVGVFLFGEFFDVFAADDGHGQRDGMFVEDGNLYDKLVFQLDEEGVE